LQEEVKVDAHLNPCVMITNERVEKSKTMSSPVSLSMKLQETKEERRLENY